MKNCLKKSIAHMLSVLMIMSVVGAGLTAFGIVQPETVNAASASEIAVGDHVTLGKTDAEGYKKALCSLVQRTINTYRGTTSIAG